MKGCRRVGPVTVFLILIGVAMGCGSASRPRKNIWPAGTLSGSASLCASEAAEQGLDCGQLEEKILGSTLRIEIQTWIVYVEGQGYTRLSGNGFGTVKDGRHLLTHNHFDLPLPELLAGGNDAEFATVTLYNAYGDILWQGPLSAVTVAFDEAETLLLAFEDGEGGGLFESLDVPSARFDNGETASLPAGAIVAEINWDEGQAKVQWTQVQATFDEGGTPVARLGECLIPGASGGGVFLDGVHVANNWSRSSDCREMGQNSGQQHSTAALNSAKALAAARLSD